MNRFSILALLVAVLSVACVLSRRSAALEPTLATAPTAIRLSATVPAESLTPAGILAPGDSRESLEVDGRLRTYWLHLPPAFDGTTPLPLVIVLHGGGGNGLRAAQMSGMTAKADEAGFLVAYPAGAGQSAEILLTWNGGNCCGYALDHQVDDVAFIRTLIDDLSARLPIDDRRVYATGMSNGGMMTYRLGCELADRIAAIAPVAGALNVESCSPAEPMSVVAFHGTADQHVLYEGGAPIVQVDPHPRVDTSVAESVGFWVEHDGCRPIPTREQTGSLIHNTYRDCAAGVGVELYTIVGGGHAWPSGEFSATDVMWEFFAAHPRR